MPRDLSTSPDSSIDIRRYTSLTTNDKPIKASGVKQLQTPSVYIAATIVSFFLYQFDRRYDIAQIVSGP